MVGSHQVNCGEYGLAMEEGDAVLYMWQWIPIKSGHGVQSSIISAWAPVSHGFSYEVKGRGPCVLFRSPYNS